MSNGFSRVRSHILLTTSCFTSIIGLASCLSLAVLPCHGQQTKKPFTVADEIGLSLFIPHMGAPNTRFSPDGQFFALYSERGRLDLNRVEDCLRFYRSRDVEKFLEHSDESQPPSPIWVVDRSTYKEGPIINDWRWLPDSSGVAFLEGGGIFGDKRLVLADIRKRTVESLVRYSDLTRRVVIVQPHVRKSLLPANLAANTSPARQARLLCTLLHGVKADIDRYGAEFEVVVDK